MCAARGGFHILVVAVGKLLAFSCVVYHGRFKLCGAGTIGLSSFFVHLSFLAFSAWASSRCIEGVRHGGLMLIVFNHRLYACV